MASLAALVALAVPGLVRLGHRLGTVAVVTIGPLEQRGDVERRVVDPGVEVAEARRTGPGPSRW